MARLGRFQRRGGSVIEVTLLMPWYIFLFVGAFDWGFYAHALISTESAARVAALYASQNQTTWSDSSTACRLAKAELWTAANVGAAGLTSCGALPLVVTAAAAGTGQTVASPDGSKATQVTVTYQTVRLIPIPGLLPGRATFTRVVQMRLRDDS
jgi:Flp pilus assembly protein TadG